MIGISSITQLSIQTNCSNCPNVSGYPMPINGMVFLYEDRSIPKYASLGKNNRLTIAQFFYTMHGSCLNPLQYAMKFTFSQKSYNASLVYIRDVFLSDLKNSSALYYFTNTCNVNLMNDLRIYNFTITRSTGNPHLKMFHVALYNWRCFDTVAYFDKDRPKLQLNQVSFYGCKFMNNRNMKSIIYIEPTSSRVIRGSIKIRKCEFSRNTNVNFLNVESEKEIVWQLTNVINMYKVKIYCNSHEYNESNDLISVTNGMIVLQGPISVKSNTNYNNILKLQFSILIFKSYIEVSSNRARQVLIAKFGSYLVVTDNTIVNISFNTVYMLAVQERTFRINSERTCPFQFYSNKYGNLDRMKKYSFQVVAHENLHMTSKDLPGDDILFGDCTWLAGTAFQMATAKMVLSKVLKVKNTVINQTSIRPIPLSVCLCSMTGNTSNCYTPNLGGVFPGQILKIELSVSKQWLHQERLHYTTLVVKNSPSDDCGVVDASQLSQTHFNYGCNQYSYTLWPFNTTTKTCKLFLGLESIPEMFYVQLKNCPKGFTLQEDKKACFCDPILQYSSLSITTCNLDDETVLRPANSWISASTTDNTHVYQVSSNCPFNYCLPHPSYLNLSSPNSQCQFDRSGVLCGQCEHGLSVVFGSSQCKHCSNIYLFIIIPIAIAGIILVTMLFIFNLTVLNETINTFTFYVNIININMLTFYPVCQPGTCTLISLFNLDLGIETCFYNGMDDYVKMWLQLAFPLYLIMIAILLIIGSRYSTKIQRLTSRRALPVLSTIFLLCYTKILRMVCNVLFWYFKVNHLPNNITEIIWSVDTTTPVFGIKFLMMFVVSFILFFILLPFNMVLSFPRLMMRIKLVNTFKPLLDTYLGPYKDKVLFWTGLLLLIRVVVFGLSALHKDGSLLAISVALGGLLCMQGVLHPFKNKTKNIQESLLLFNLLIAHVAPLYKHHLLGLKVSQALITIGIAYMILAITIHCLFVRHKRVLHRKLKEFYVIIKSVKKSDDAEMHHFSSEIMEVTYNYKEFQEPLIGLDA